MIMGDGCNSAIKAAWDRHAQRIKYEWPMGYGSYAALQTPALLMSEAGFCAAVHEVLATIERTRATETE